jgi:hypothetical protein
MPIILPTWDAEIGRITVPGWSRKIVHEILPQPTAGHSGAHLSSQNMWEAKGMGD